MCIYYTNTYIIDIIIKSIIKKYTFNLKRFRNELVLISQVQNFLKSRD